MTIYYFSGTGNSFVTARDISQKVNGNLVSIPGVINAANIRIKSGYHRDRIPVLSGSGRRSAPYQGVWGVKADLPRADAADDKSIAVGDDCTGCGMCARVCPANNIDLVNKRPEFQHRCEMCFACDEWCPQSAIQHWSRAKGIKHHHPGVRSPMYLWPSRESRLSTTTPSRMRNAKRHRNSIRRRPFLSPWRFSSFLSGGPIFLRCPKPL